MTDVAIATHKKEIISNDSTIYALKAGNEDFLPSRILESLKKGEGRFGWSYDKASNINEIKAKLDESNWASLSKDEQEFYEKAAFMLNIKAGDWVVYINMPTYGRCVAAKVTGSYLWRFDEEDFNHRFPVDASSVFEFDRNDAKVFPKLRARLKLQGRWWTIYAKEEFSKLVEAQSVGFVATPYTAKTNFNFLAREIRPHLAEITKSMHRTHPNKDLEPLIAAAMRNVPGVQNVKCQGGAGDHGADILVEFESGLPIAGLRRQRTCLVQVKSFEGEHWDTKAVNDIRRGFEHYPDAEMGLIVSTAAASTAPLDAAIQNLSDECKKPVSLLIGEDVASFFLQYGLGFSE